MAWVYAGLVGLISLNSMCAVVVLDSAVCACMQSLVQAGLESKPDKPCTVSDTRPHFRSHTPACAAVCREKERCVCVLFSLGIRWFMFAE
ncbi:hypothetical protein GQ55_8G243300 [Panicum hallii var. hallii]|uniref:Bifunctional inhibitor/plant lipid transfer protein/seed storage helical domain-containing protein n=1 Tax=Panicum hallii var. hallii TaxID=1504633 RepID=A0A2T7CQR1_9POAL|nr:hypothetical protein GQ55_8G243300 [Panicum hallii var. hallii]